MTMAIETVENIQCQGGCGKIILHLDPADNTEDFFVLCYGCADLLKASLAQAMRILPDELPRWVPTVAEREGR